MFIRIGISFKYEAAVFLASDESSYAQTLSNYGSAQVEACFQR